MRLQFISTAAMCIACCCTISATAFASDHADSPNGSKDPTADVTDIFAFASPENPGHLALVLNVAPGAFNNARFSDAVTYSLRVRPEVVATSARELRIDCVFDLVAAAGSDQMAKCTAYNFDPASGRLYETIKSTPTPVNESSDGRNGLRIFTGMRADPWHIDAPGSVPAIKGEGWKYTTGKNTLAGLDVLSIVVELDVAKLFGGVKHFKVAGETTMRVRP